MAAVRSELRRRLFALAAEQGGFFTAAQAKDVGYSYQAQAHHVEAGNWLRVDRAIFRLVEWVPSLYDELARWTLWSRGRGVVSHESALSVHGVGEFEALRVHLTVPPGFRKTADVVRLHRADLPPSDVMDHAGFRITTVARSLIDVAASGVDEDQLARAVDEARRSGLLTIRQLRSRAEAVDVRAALHIERAIHWAEAS